MAISVYSRIANPYGYGGSNSINVATLVSPGELGCAWADQNTGRVHLLVQVDSQTSSIGAITVGQLAFWTDRANNKVSNDKLLCDAAATTNGALNRIAGVFTVAATAGNYTALTINGPAVLVASTNTGTIGIAVIGDSTASVARVTALATAITAPTSQVVGVLRGTPASNLASVDVALGVAF